jgi:uroporphyrinogen decarboxylase
MATAVRAENSVESMTTDQMEEAIRHFNARVDAAQAKSLPTKDWVRRAVRRQGAPRCPARIRRLSYDVILRHGDALADLFCEFPDETLFLTAYDIFVGYQPPERTNRINPVDVLMHEAQWTDEWGTRWAHAHGGVGATPSDHPIADWSQLDEYLRSKMPDPLAPGRLDAIRPAIEMHGKTRYCVGNIHLATFERLHSLRGMQNTFADFCTNQSEVRRLLEALVEYLIGLTRAWAKLGVDAVFYTDDWGTQTSLMISPAMWRSYFKEHYRRVFAEAHRLGMDVILHSCGNVMSIVPDLIDVGLDMLDPIQPGAMDMVEVARRFGGHLAFCGGIDIQDLLVFGSPQQVKDGVRRVIDTLGRPFGNSLIVGPANTMTPEIPLENLRAMFEACHNQ